MIKRFVLSCMTLFVFLLGNAQVPSADKLMSDAYASAKKENKNIIVMFHASWCGWCHKMDKSMNDPECKKLFDDNYITVHMTVEESDGKKDQENPGAAELKTKYLGDGSGLPFWLVFDKDGKLLGDSKMRKNDSDFGENVGCPASKEEVELLINILKKTSRLKEDELKVIEKRFRRNES